MLVHAHSPRNNARLIRARENRSAKPDPRPPPTEKYHRPSFLPLPAPLPLNYPRCLIRRRIVCKIKIFNSARTAVVYRLGLRVTRPPCLPRASSCRVRINYRLKTQITLRVGSILYTPILVISFALAL